MVLKVCWSAEPWIAGACSSRSLTLLKAWACSTAADWTAVGVGAVKPARSTREAVTTTVASGAVCAAAGMAAANMIASELAPANRPTPREIPLLDSILFLPVLFIHVCFRSAERRGLGRTEG